MTVHEDRVAHHVVSHDLAITLNLLARRTLTSPLRAHYLSQKGSLRNHRLAGRGQCSTQLRGLALPILLIPSPS